MDLEKHAHIRDSYVGEEAYLHTDVLRIHRPINRGVVSEWKDFSALVSYALTSLQVTGKKALSETPVILTEPPRNPKRNRERMFEILFDDFNVPAAYVANQVRTSLASIDVSLLK